MGVTLCGRGFRAGITILVVLGLFIVIGVQSDVIRPVDHLSGKMPAMLSSLHSLANQEWETNDFLQNGLLKAPPIEECKYILEIFFLQDISDSFSDDVLNVKKQIPDVLRDLNDNYPGSRLGFGTFIDKPVPGVGDFDPDQVLSHCLKIETPLDNDFERVADVFKTYGDDLTIQGGFDDPEVQLESMMRAALSNAVQWTSDEFDPVTGRPIVRIIVLSTDTFTQTAGALYVKLTDALVRDIHHCQTVYKGPGPEDIHENDLLHRPHDLDEDPNHDCGVVDYPLLADVGEALRRRNIVPIFLVSPAGDFLPEGFKSKPDFTNSIGMKDYRANSYTIYHEYLRQMNVTGVIHNMDQMSFNFRERINAAIAQAVELRCVPPVTTTTTTTASSSKEDAIPPPVVSTEKPSKEPEVETTAEDMVPEEDESTNAEETIGGEETDSDIIGGEVTEEDVGTTLAPLPPVRPTAPTKKPESEKTPKPDVTEPVVEPTKPASKTKTKAPNSETTDHTTEAAGGGAAVTTIVSSAVGGAVSAAAIGGLVYAKQVGLLFSNSSVPQIDANIVQDVDVPDVQVDREAYEVVTADAFA